MLTLHSFICRTVGARLRNIPPERYVTPWSSLWARVSSSIAQPQSDISSATCIISYCQRWTQKKIASLLQEYCRKFTVRYSVATKVLRLRKQTLLNLSHGRWPPLQNVQNVPYVFKLGLPLHQMSLGWFHIITKVRPISHQLKIDKTFNPTFTFYRVHVNIFQHKF